MTSIRELFDVEREKGVLVLSPRGDIAGFLDQDVKQQIESIEQQIHSGEVRHLLVDCAYSRYFGSVVIGVVHSLARFVRERGGVLVLCHVSEEMAQVLRIMKLDDSLPQFDNRKVALKYLNKVDPASIG